MMPNANGYRSTPVLLSHAKQRCAEMGISTKVAKQIVRDPSIVRPGGTNHDSERLLAYSDRHPRYAVAFYPGEPAHIITVIFNDPAFVARNGRTYIREDAYGTA